MTNKGVEKLTVKELEIGLRIHGEALRELCAAYLGCKADEVSITVKGAADTKST